MTRSRERGWVAEIITLICPTGWRSRGPLKQHLPLNFAEIANAEGASNRGCRGGASFQLSRYAGTVLTTEQLQTDTS